LESVPHGERSRHIHFLGGSELLELFQWVGSDEAIEHDRAAMADELADVLIYAVQFADLVGLDLDTIVAEKLSKTAEKYPARSVARCRDKYELHPAHGKGR
jgi:NTP pyrophosphatase (non-canonical NTP hydrolase)